MSNSQATTQQTQTVHLRRHIRAPPERVYKAFLPMKKLDISAIEAAYEGRT